MTTRTWRQLGTDVHVSVLHPGDLLRAEQVAHRTLHHVDVTCSRFRPDSDLSRANRSPGRRVRVDPLLAAGVRVAVEAAWRTDGLVTPLLGRDLVVLGYDRDLAVVRREPADSTHEPTHRPDLLRAWQEVEVGEAWVRVPPGTALDLGSTGKAWAADLVAAALADRLDGPAAVSVGGDVALTAGAPPWPVDVAGVGQVLLHGGGLATSSTRVRRWRHGGVERHHLLDPRTGLPAPEVWHQASATGPSCVAANTASTAAVVLGTRAPAWLQRHRVPAALVDGSGRLRTTTGWPVTAGRRIA